MSGKSGPRKKRAKEMREKIINVTMDLCETRTIEEITVAEIAERAGCTPGNIYHYFRSKEGIVPYATFGIDASYQKIANRLFRQDMEPLDRFLAFQNGLYTTCSTMPLGTEYYVYGLKHPENNVIRLDEHRASHQIYQRIFGDCLHRHALREELEARDGIIERLIRDINTVNRGVVVEWILSEKKTDIVEDGMELSRIFANGIRREKTSE